MQCLTKKQLKWKEEKVGTCCKQSVPLCNWSIAEVAVGTDALGFEGSGK